jgi:hypothetical protein
MVRKHGIASERVNVNLILMSARAFRVQIKSRVATGSRLVKHKYYNAIVKKQDCIILKTFNKNKILVYQPIVILLVSLKIKFRDWFGILLVYFV